MIYVISLLYSSSQSGKTFHIIHIIIHIPAMRSHQLHEAVNRLHCSVRASLAWDRQLGQCHKKVSGWA